jgi:hypothetical protein
MVQAIEL